MEAYSENTNTHYPSWEALVEAEANGHVVVAIMTSATQSWPWVVGPFPTKREANNAKNRLRRTLLKERSKQAGENLNFSLFVRPAWKDPR